MATASVKYIREVKYDEKIYPTRFRARNLQGPGS